MTHKEVMQQALDALEQLDGIDTETECVTIDVGDAITALRQALAEQPAQQEPSQGWAGMDGATAWQLIHRHADGWADIAKMMGEWLAANTLPATQRQPLTKDQIAAAYTEHEVRYSLVASAWSFEAGVQFAEAAHGITGESK